MEPPSTGYAHLPLNGFVGYFGKNSFVKQQMPFVLEGAAMGKGTTQIHFPSLFCFLRVDGNRSIWPAQ